MKEVHHRQYFIGYRDFDYKEASREVFLKCLKDITKKEYNMLINGRRICHGDVCFYIKDEYEKLKKDVFKYNNSLEEKEQRYLNSIKESKASLRLRFLYISAGEYTKDQLVEMGYYTDVIRCVRGYYDTLPAVDAYRDMVAEHKLAIYLDDYYQNVVYAYKLNANL